MIGNLAALRTKSAKPAKVVERKELFTTLTILAGAAMVTEWMTDYGQGGWIMRAIEWMTDEKARLESRINALEDRIFVAEAVGDDVTAMLAELDTLERRLEMLERAEDEAGGSD